MNALPAVEAYRLWAPTYGPETAVSALEARLVDTLSPSPRGRRLLDAGCGTGRRLAAAADACFAAGIDLVPEMLARGLPAPRVADAGGRRTAPDLAADDVAATHHSRRLRLAAANVCCLPFRDDTFDLVWCRLVLGHLPSLGQAYAELARVCSEGGAVIVTDFHPAAAAAGHRRTFRTVSGDASEVAHHVHTATAHRDAAADAGLALGVIAEEPVGPPAQPFYAAAGRLDRYQADLGLPLVLGLRFQLGASGPRL